MATPKSGATAPVILNETQLETLAGMGCTLKEMAAFFKCDVSTLTRNYADVLEQGRENGKVSVRRMLWKQGERGNSVALKYLVHNVLKERIEEKADNFIVQNTDIQEQLKKLQVLSPEDIKRLAKEPPKAG